MQQRHGKQWHNSYDKSAILTDVWTLAAADADCFNSNV